MEPSWPPRMMAVILITNQPTMPTNLPILDLRDFSAEDLARRAAFVTQLQTVAHDVGFFYLTGYSAAPGETDRLFRTIRAFFELPAGAKDAIRMVHSPHFRGYTGPGEELTRGERDWREQFDIGAERHALPALPELPGWARLQGPNQWPTELPELKPELLAWQETLSEVSRTLLRALALVLGQPETTFDAAFADLPVQHLKVIRYPGQAAGNSPQGVGPHKDAGCLTFVLQHERGGLQVLDRRGNGEPHWIDVPPIPGTLVVNLGEVLEVQSNGYLRANIHQVVSPPSDTDRLSVAFFFSPRLDAELPPLTLPPELARRARGVDRDPRNPLIAHTGRNLLKGRLRSHPDVALRHHRDLLAAENIRPGLPASAYA